MAKEIKFDVCHPGEMGAGIWGYSDAVTVTVENDPGGEEGEFEKYMRECLAEWFDGAKVTPNICLTCKAVRTCQVEAVVRPTITA